MSLKSFLSGRIGTAATFATDLAVLSIGAYLSYTNIGVPLSNANGSEIRSTVTSGLYAGNMVVGTALFAMDLSVRLAMYRPAGLKWMFVAGMAAAIASLPFLVYYNFYYGYTTLIGGTTYTVYPYGVQPGIPFMLALLISFSALLQMLARWANKRKFSLMHGPAVRISKNGISIYSSHEERKHK